MKVLFVTTCYPSEKLPQYCVFLEQQALALQKRGHRVDVLHIEDNAGSQMGAPLQHGVNVIRYLPTTKKTKLDLFFPRCFNATDSNVIYKILKNGYDVVSFHMGDLRLLRTLCKECRIQNIPLVQHFHGLGIWHYYYDLHPWLTAYTVMLKKHIYSGLSAMVGVSNKVQQIFERKVKMVPAYTVYNGVDTDRFAEKINRIFFKDSVIKILCVANLIPIKGQKYLIEAAAKLTKMGCSVEVTFAGCGPDENMLKALAAQKSVKANFLGYLPYDEVAELMQDCDIFIMPSFYEALGCVYLEAMSSGMITVGVKGQGIDEIIADGENGFLVNPKSAVSIVNAVTHIVNLPLETLQEIARNGRKSSLCYTWGDSACMLERVYLDVTNGGHK